MFIVKLKLWNNRKLVFRKVIDFRTLDDKFVVETETSYQSFGKNLFKKIVVKMEKVKK